VSTLTNRSLHLARLLIVALAVATAGPGSAWAHTRSQSFSSWRIQDGRIHMTYSVVAREATRLSAIEGQFLDLGEVLLRHLRPRVRVSSDGQACPTLDGPRRLTSQRGYLRVDWTFECPPGSSIEIENNSFFQVAPSHVHFARVEAGGRRPIEYLFTNHERVRSLTLVSDETELRSESRGTTLVRYIRLGIDHIVEGYDHLAFLLSLILLATRFRDVALTITGFTIGHSLTLSLAVLGFARPNLPVIEAMIGFTIALVAAENIGVTTRSNRTLAGVAGAMLGTLAVVAAFVGIGPPVATLAGLALFSACYLTLSETPRLALRLRPAATVLFGLVHGFGFASVLMELGIPRDRLLVGLFGFNVGVEIGQLMIVTALSIAGALLLRWVIRFERRLATDFASAALCGLGLFWFFQRAYGG
jgi:hypothetical protein